MVMVGGSLLEVDRSMVVGEGFLGLLESGAFFSNDAVEYTTVLDAFIPLLAAEPFPPQDHFIVLGEFALAPLDVRAAILSRTASYDEPHPDIESTVLLTYDEEDRLILPTVAERHANVIPNARTSFYLEVGHSPPLENTERFNRERREFVTGL